ncbi:unnamed protein product, partial [Musa acuminata var. zebrina]
MGDGDSGIHSLLQSSLLPQTSLPSSPLSPSHFLPPSPTELLGHAGIPSAPLSDSVPGGSIPSWLVSDTRSALPRSCASALFRLHYLRHLVGLESNILYLESG